MQFTKLAQHWPLMLQGAEALASQILTAMEGAAARTPGAYSIYGSIKHKQVYLYGGLDVSPSVLSRGYGMAWGVGGWLLPNFLSKNRHGGWQ